MDGETYLRLTWERMLAGDPQQGRPGPNANVAAVGRAVVAAGLLDETAVTAIADEYYLAMDLRGRPSPRFMGGFRGGEREVLSAVRVALGDFEIDNDNRRFTVTKIVFGEKETRIDATGTQSRGNRTRRGGPRPRMPGFRMRPGPADPGTLALRDDHGTTASAAPHGWGGSHTGWQATFHSDRPLAADTVWIEIEGSRIELPPPGAAATIQVEPVDSNDSIAESLRQEILLGLNGQVSVEDFITALVAVGAVGPDDTEIVAARAAASALQSGRPSRSVGPPWDAVLKRSAARDGPTGSTSIGAVIESVAGHSVRLDSLISQPEYFSVDAAISPGAPLMPRHFFPGTQIGPSPISWWAEDERGNVYLGAADGRGGSNSSAEGTIVFMAPLDPRANQLRLIPTGRHERAIVTFSLERLRS
jgi:hypothetical protein